MQVSKCARKKQKSSNLSREPWYDTEDEASAPPFHIGPEASAFPTGSISMDTSLFNHINSGDEGALKIFAVYWLLF